MIDFGNPYALWLFLIVPYFVVLHYRSFSDMGVFQRRLSLFLRIVLISSIILALADTRLVKTSDKLSVFFLWDTSRSIVEEDKTAMLEYIRNSSTALNKDKDTVGVIAFGREAYVETGLDSKPPEIAKIESEVHPDFTNIAQAIDLAVAALPADSESRIVLLSDGNENIGDAIESARIASNRGITIDVVPFGSVTEGEVSAGRIILPRRVEEGEIFDVRAVVESETESDAVISIFENRQLIGEQKVHLLQGKNVFSFPQKHNDGGFYQYDVQVSGVKGDKSDANNRATDYTIVEGKPKVCYVSGDPAERPYLVNKLRENGIQADFRNLSGLPGSIIEMAQYDAIFFSDIGAELLMKDTMNAYQAYVRDLGKAFVMLGGENSLGPGGYYKTPIEEILPVSLELKKKEYMPSIAIALVIDRSGSMGMVEVDGSIKIEIAKEACALVAELLDSSDQFAVLTFDTMSQVVVPMGTLENLDEVIRKIGTIQPGGGTAVYPGMYAGYQALKQSDAKIKHMIVLSDGITEGGAFDELVSQMNNDKITLSTLSVGSDSNLFLMEHLAKMGGGNHYLCTSISSIPRIFTKETFLSAKRSMIEEPFLPVTNMFSPVTDNIDWSSAKPLLGYIATTLKPRAIEALSTNNADPLLAHWQYGLGRSLVFTSDAKNHWAAGWLNWDGYEKLWTQASRWLVGGNLQGNLVPNVYMKGGNANISVDAIDEFGNMMTDATIKARIVNPPPEFDSVELDLFQVAPGRYQASIPADKIGSYLVNIYQEDSEGNLIDQVSSGFSVSYPPEFEKSEPNLFLLSRIADIGGGKLGLPMEEVFKHSNKSATHYFQLWTILLTLFICLLPIDIAVRRLSITGESMEYFGGKVRAFAHNIMARKEKSESESAHLKELRKVKEMYRLRSKSDQSLSRDEEVKNILETISTPKETSSQAEKTATKKKETPPQPEEKESSLDRLKEAKKRTWDERKD